MFLCTKHSLYTICIFCTCDWCVGKCNGCIVVSFGKQLDSITNISENGLASIILAGLPLVSGQLVQLDLMVADDNCPFYVQIWRPNGLFQYNLVYNMKVMFYEKKGNYTVSIKSIIRDII